LELPAEGIFGAGQSVLLRGSVVPAQGDLIGLTVADDRVGFLDEELHRVLHQHRETHVVRTLKTLREGVERAAIEASHQRQPAVCGPTGFGLLLRLELVAQRVLRFNHVETPCRRLDRYRSGCGGVGRRRESARTIRRSWARG